MIYEFPAGDAPIRQGDVFRQIPKASMSLERMSIVPPEGSPEEVRWEDVRESDQSIVAMVGITAVTAVVITQDCDTIRAPDISLCEIKPFADLVSSTPPRNDKKWIELLRTQTLKNLKWFYLPPDGRIFANRMAVDFQAVLRVPRDELERARHLRVGRLNGVADEHFRERLAEFFRRYPYNEWYPFSKAEFEAYKAEHPQEESIEPYDHQK